jgi:hypothetical protein
MANILSYFLGFHIADVGNNKTAEIKFLFASTFFISKHMVLARFLLPLSDIGDRQQPLKVDNLTIFTEEKMQCLKQLRLIYSVLPFS